ncbi:MAG: lpdA [Mucilaginibacter sp.]|nr:lpdA [Mucilaginibacter sp.]
MATEYDIIVIGSGPGGYTAAIRASQLSSKVAIVERYPALGGTCTNVGCIPAKALLDSSENFHNAKVNFSLHGIELGQEPVLNFPQFLKRKESVVAANNAGLSYLMRKNKIDVVKGFASFVSSRQIAVAGDGGVTELAAKNYIIATGSKPATIPGVVIDKKRIITSTESMVLNERPKSMVIIGGGVIGVEMASVFARIGTDVTIIEYAGALIPLMDRELGSALARVLQKLNIKLYLNSKVDSATNLGDKAVVRFTGSDGNKKELEAEYALVATGRKPYTEGLTLDNAGVQTEKDGSIRINAVLQTSNSAIYAIGDVIRGPMLAHKAEDEGVFVAETIHGQIPHINYDLIPNVVYTWPEVASIGKSEEQLKMEGIAYRLGKFPFSASGRARASGDTEGFAKVIVSTKYGEVLGVHIIGARAADIIAQCVVGMEYEVTVEDMYRICYAHPTYSEVLKDAYMLADGREALNI